MAKACACLCHQCYHLRLRWIRWKSSICSLSSSKKCLLISLMHWGLLSFGQWPQVFFFFASVINISSTLTGDNLLNILKSLIIDFICQTLHRHSAVCQRLFPFFQIQFHWTFSQKAKNQKAKQTVVHCTTKQYNTRQEMKWNAMQCNEKITINQEEWYWPIGILGGCNEWQICSS